ncbi:MAG: TonB-dependent receptor [Pseudomonadota bacterium]
MSIKPLKIKRVTASAVCALSTAMPAMAQTGDDDEASTLTQDIIVVTARFREESVQDLGASISAISGDDIAREGITDFDDIARRTVGLDLIDRGPNQNDPSIRGVSNGVLPTLSDNGGVSPLISQFLDEIPVAASTGSQRDYNYFDFERVEVLRGPQPTLFGEGSVGGTIRYFTKSPDLDGGTINDSIIKSGVSFTDGGGVNYSVSAASSLILVPDVLGIRGVINYRDDDGFIDNPILGQEDINTYESLSGRAVVLYEPTDQFSARLTAFIGRDDLGENNFVTPFLPPATLLPAESLQSFVPTDGFTEDDFTLISGRLTYDFGNIEATSITGFYSRNRNFTSFEPLTAAAFGAFLPAPLSVSQEFLSDDRNITQEFRFVSKFDGPLNFVSGFFFQDTALDLSINSSAPEFGDFVVMPAGSDTLIVEETLIDTRQFSGFVELTYDLTDRLRLIGGVRFVNERITSETLASQAPFGGGPFAIEPPFVALDTAGLVVASGLPLAETFTLNRFLPRGVIEFKATDDILLYASASTGVRNGGLNPASSSFSIASAAAAVDPAAFLPAFAAARTFDEDDVLTFEGGVKASLFGWALTSNSSVYFTSFDGQQVQSASPLLFATNGPDVEIFGIEQEIFWKPNDYLSLFLSGAYTDATFTEDALIVPAAAAFGFEADILDGSRTANTPEFSFSAGADVKYPLGDSGLSLIGNTSFQFIDERFSTVQNFPSSLLEPLTILNFRLGFEHDNWSIVGYVNNLTNDLEFQSLDGNPGLPVLAADGALDIIPLLGSVNRPRTFGFEATVRF